MEFKRLTEEMLMGARDYVPLMEKAAFALSRITTESVD